MHNNLNREFSIEESQMVEEVFKEMFYIPGYQGNANQNYFEIPIYSCHKG